MSDPPRQPPTLGGILARPRGLDLLWLLLPPVLAAIGFGLLPLRSWDYWWHLAIGRLVDHWGAVPAANHFLYTLPADTPSYVQPWLAQLLLYGLHELWNVHAGLLARNVAAATAFAGLTWAAVRRSRSVPAGSLCALAGLVFALRLMEVRPRLFAWPIFLGLLGIGYGVRSRGWHPGWTLAFPAGTALWANLHGSFLLGPAAGGAFVAASVVDSHRGEGDGRWPWWGGAFAASLAAPLANPRGPELYGYVYSLATDDYVRTTVTEWLPTMPTRPPVVGPLFYATVLAAAALLWRRRTDADPADVFLLTGTALLAALQVRGLLWWGLTLPVAVSPYARGLLEAGDDEPGPLARRLHTAAAGGLLLFGLAVQPMFQWRVDWTASSPLFEVRRRQPLRGVVPDETPFEAVELLARYADPPRVFHDQRYAGFILFHLTGVRPARTVFVDQRIELPPPRIWKLYEQVVRQPDVWRGVFQQYDVGAAILSRHQQPELIDRMAGSEGWSMSRSTSDWVLLVRN
ncbi:MAG: hypothetical protein ABEL76_11070 [Bradymonadaceae bacterium]